MRRFEIRTSTPVALVIITLGLPIAGFLLLMGIANLINPDVPDEGFVNLSEIHTDNAWSVGQETPYILLFSVWPRCPNGQESA